MHSRPAVQNGLEIAKIVLVYYFLFKWMCAGPVLLDLTWHSHSRPSCEVEVFSTCNQKYYFTLECFTGCSQICQGVPFFF